LTDVNAVDDDLARVGFQSPHQCHRERALPSAGASYDSDFLSRLDFHVEIPKYRLEIGSVAGTVIDELDRTFSWPVSWWSEIWVDGRSFLVYIQDRLHPFHVRHILLVFGEQSNDPVKIQVSSVYIIGLGRRVNKQILLPKYSLIKTQRVRQ
jgi:hypothetical protein